MGRLLLLFALLSACGGASAPTPSATSCSSDGGFCGDANLICCEGSCTDITSDANNCGACGFICGPGGACFGGSCS
ncbi:MAG: hypothetical protein ACYCWW_09575 [Deltaproteobacteria bacterium]